LAEDNAALGDKKRRHARTLNALTLALSLVGVLVAPFAKQNGREAAVIITGGVLALLWALITFLLAMRLRVVDSAIFSTLYSALLPVIGFLIIMIFNLSPSDGWQAVYVELIIGTILFGIYFLQTQFRRQ
jgi:hypothetical protein